MLLTKPRSMLLAAVALAGLTGTACAEIHMVRVTTTTFFKTSTAQASALAAGNKCELSVGRSLETSVPTLEAGHLRVSLKKSIPGCGFTTGYLYEPHVAKSNTALTAFANTVFKRSAADSSTLPAADKCSMPSGVYRLSGAVTDAGSHYKANLAAFLPGCSFSQGYVFEEHAMPGVQAFTLWESAWLKSSTADSSTLPASQKCLVAAGNYTLAAPPDAEGTHYQLNLSATPAGCTLRSGFMFHANTSLAEPSTASSAGYTFPLTNGVLGSGWCVCRNVGTSPHIGQDTYASGTMRAVAIADGVVQDRFFDSACGHFLVLRDDGGSLWRYVHLNSPSVAIGNRVTRGQQLATISAYPSSSCGTGPHLHWERRSAGAFGDSATGKDCGQGYRSCNFDPVKPFRSAKQADLQDALPLRMPAVTTPLVQLEASVVQADADVAPVRLCMSDPADYPSDVLEVSQSRSVTGSDIDVQLQQVEREGVQVLVGSASLRSNPGNVCAASEGRNCLVSWTLLAQQSNGNWVRVFHDPAVRNQRLQRVADEAWCAPSQSNGQYAVLLKDLSGQRYVQRVDLSSR